MYESIKFKNDGGVGILTLARPEAKNAIDSAMRKEIAALLTALNGDQSLKTLIITGEGGAFCSGGDIRAYQQTSEAEGSAEARRQRIIDLHFTANALLQFDRPVIAAVEGAAFGAGLSLALTSDMVLAADNARFCLSFGRLGAVPDFGALYTLPRIVGLQRAKELIFSAREFDATEARAMGMVLEVHPAGTVLDRAREIADSLTKASSLALSVSKRALNVSLHSNLQTMLMLEADGQGIAMTTAYVKEAVRRFLAKQSPMFSWPRRAGE